MNNYYYDEDRLVVCPDCGNSVERWSPRIIHPCQCDALMLGLIG